MTTYYRDYPTQGELRELFDYHEDGYLVNKFTRNYNALAGQRAGHQKPHPDKGYYQIWVGKRTMYMHVAIWIYHNGSIPVGLQVDHIVGVSEGGTDSIDNLRLLTQSRNQHKATIRKDNTFGLKAINPIRGKFRVRISKDGVRHHIGYYNTKEEAIQAYNEAATELYGDVARLQ